MNIQATIADLLTRWPVFLFIAVRILFVAIAFEVAAWFLGRKLENLAAPFIELDQNRDPKWRMLRRQTLAKTPKIVLRTLLYSIALVLIFNIFGLPVLELSLSIGAVALLFGAASVGVLRDYAQGYAILSEDTLAPGDAVQIGAHQGIIERWTLRSTWLRDREGRLVVISNRDAKEIVIYRRASEAANNDKAAFDPLQK